MEHLNTVELPLNVVKEISLVLESLIEKEIDTKTSFKHKFVDESGKEIKNPTPKQIESKKLQKVFDLDRTIFDPKMETTITELGIKYTKLKYFLDGNIRKKELESVEEKPVAE